MIKVDLHLHSHVSDGHLAPAEVVRSAHAAGLDVIALTDHDTAAGVEEAVEAARGLPLTVVPGIEISTRWGEHEFHVLGYWIDTRAPSILAHQEASVRRREGRMERMVAKLRDMGVGISYEEVLAAAGPAARSLGRPHLARALLAGGHTRYYGEAFDRYLRDGGPAFVKEPFPSPSEAIRDIQAAGGLAVWAHPPLDLVEGMIGDFSEWGVDGIECYRPSLTAPDVALLLRLTRGLGLVATGGSDWHGPHRAALGDFYIPPENVRELLAHGGWSPPARGT